MNFSQQDLSSFSPRDRKLIKDNPGKSIYDLTLLGLSAKASERLKEMEQQAPAEVQENEVVSEVIVAAATVEKATSGPIRPVTVEKVNVSASPSRVSQPNKAKTGGVWIKNLGTGLPQFMNEESANRLVKKNPTRFKLL